MSPPRPGEMIYGCTCPRACGCVADVVAHVTSHDMNHFIVREDFHGRTTRVRREPNGQLYEVTIVHDAA